MTEKQYGALVARMAPKSPMWRDCLNAFWIGGLICVVGQIFTNCYGAWGLEKQDAGTAASMTLVALSALLTGLSVYDDIAKHAGSRYAGANHGICQRHRRPGRGIQDRGLRAGRGRKNVHHRGAGDRVRPGRKRGVWVYLLAVYDSIRRGAVIRSKVTAFFRSRAKKRF